MFVIPGLATFEHLELAIESGVTVFRLRVIVQKQIRLRHIWNISLARDFDWGLLMMAHMIKPDLLAREAKKWKAMVLHVSPFWILQVL